MKFMYRTLTLISFTLFLSASHAHDGEDHGEQELVGGRVLGAIDFPTSTRSEEAQAAFIRGMLLLHLFEYPFAEQEFRRAREIDPGFVMAYWGEAMTHNHPVWDEQAPEKAFAVLNALGSSPEARLSKTRSRKEKDYLAALDVLYGEGDAAGKARRDADYMRYMGRMALDYPDDHEVQLFYALAMIGTSAGVRDIPTYMESTAISQRVFYANRQHPGAAHYLIHGVDDPVHAPLGLEAARALAVLAPDAGHSLHMTSHIFTAVGLWADVVEANIEAARVANAMRAEQGEPRRSYGHYDYWLLYGLLQQGRYDEAETLLRSAYKEITDAGYIPEDPLDLVPERSDVGSVVRMWSRYLLEATSAGHAIDGDMKAWTFTMGEAFDPWTRWHFTHAFLAVDADRAAIHHAEFRRLKDELKTAISALDRQAPRDLLYLERLEVMDHQLAAARAADDGNAAAALQHAREADRREGAMPFSFGPPFVDVPSAELLGELLLAEGQYDEAAQAFTTALERTRLKAQPLLGLSRAERARGNVAAADYAMAQYRRVRQGK
jgi:tetratricopeptide (TPR) repeat protein